MKALHKEKSGKMKKKKIRNTLGTKKTRKEKRRTIKMRHTRRKTGMKKVQGTIEKKNMEKNSKIQRKNNSDLEHQKTLRLSSALAAFPG